MPNPPLLMAGILPPNATHYERVLASNVDRLIGLDVTRLRNLWNAWECHEDDLPYLAWAFSVDMWDSSWPIEKRRSVVASAIELHSLKGTLEGISRYVAIADGEVISAITPPGYTLLMPAFTEEERISYLLRFAQLRVYPYVARATKRFAHFTSQAFGRNKSFLAGVEDSGVGYVHDVRAWQRYKRTAKLWDRGEETDLSIRTFSRVTSTYQVQEFDEIVLPSKASGQIFLNQPPKEHMYLSLDRYVGERLIALRRDVSITEAIPREIVGTLDMRLDFINVRPTYVFEEHPAQKTSLFAGRFLNRITLPKTVAQNFIYERWHIHDPDRVPDERKRMTHLGYTRLGMPPYHAELKIAVRGRRYPREVSRYMHGFLPVHNHKPLDQVREATSMSMALRDKVLIATKTKRPVAVGDRIRAGTYTIGQLVEN